MINSRPGMTLTSEEKEADVFGPKNSSFVFLCVFWFKFLQFFSPSAHRGCFFLINSRVKDHRAFDRENHLFALFAILRALLSQINETTFCF